MDISPFPVQIRSDQTRSDKIRQDQNISAYSNIFSGHWIDINFEIFVCIGILQNQISARTGFQNMLKNQWKMNILGQIVHNRWNAMASGILSPRRS